MGGTMHSQNHDTTTERRGRRWHDGTAPPSLQTRDGGTVFSLSFFVLLATPHRREQLLAGWIPTPAPTTTMMRWAQETLVSWAFFFFLFFFVFLAQETRVSWAHLRSTPRLRAPARRFDNCN
jgi:hypothetical protein